MPYLGKTSIIVRNEAISKYSFREVTAPIHGTNRTVTCENWFTSIALLQRMLKDPYDMTITGTLKKISAKFQPNLKLLLNIRRVLSSAMRQI